MTLACGRLLRLMARPAQPGDAADYQRARAAALDAAEALGLDLTDRRPNYTRQRLAGAAGDR